MTFEFSSWSLCKSLVWLCRLAIPVLGRQKQEVPGAHWPPRKAHLVSSRPVRDTVSKTRYMVSWRMTQKVGL